MLEGSLSEFQLPDVLRIISISQKTGVLEVEGAEARGWLFFRDGAIQGAISSVTAEPLTALMVRNGSLQEEDLDQVVKTQEGEESGNGKSIGDLLQEKELIGSEALEHFVNERIFDVLIHLLPWNHGYFKFVSMPIPETYDLGVSAEVEELIAEGERRRGLWAGMKVTIPSRDMVFQKISSPPHDSAIAIKTEEWRLLSLINGAREMDEVAALAGLGEFAAVEVFCSLVEAGLIEKVELDKLEGGGKKLKPTKREPAVEEAEAESDSKSSAETDEAQVDESEPAEDAAEVEAAEETVTEESGAEVEVAKDTVEEAEVDIAVEAEELQEEQDKDARKRLSGRLLLEELTVLTGKGNVKKKGSAAKTAGAKGEERPLVVSEEVLHKIKSKLEEL